MIELSNDVCDTEPVSVLEVGSGILFRHSAGVAVSHLEIRCVSTE